MSKSKNPRKPTSNDKSPEGFSKRMKNGRYTMDRVGGWNTGNVGDQRLIDWGFRGIETRYRPQGRCEF